MEISVYIAASVDGYIAREDGGIDWLHNPEYLIEGEDFGYSAIMAQTDVLLMGRGTYDTVAKFDPWPYDKPVWVVTNSLVPEDDRVFFVSGTPAELLTMLSARNLLRVYLDGGALIRSFLKEGLVTGMIVTQIPLLLGNGRPLFAGVGSTIPLKVADVKSWSNGFVQVHYLPA